MTRILALALGVLCTVGALAALAARQSATAVVIDLDVAGLALTVLAVPLLGWGISSGTQRPRWRVVRRRIGACALVLAVAAALGLAYPRLVLFASEELRFTNGAVQLAGTLYTPRHALAAAVVLVHGSGPETRDKYRFYARWLAEHGVAALAYDKRGTGASSGGLYESTYAGYADDVVAAVDAVMAHVDVAPGAVGLVGFSEAEWVAPLAAAASPSIGFVAIIGASGISPAEQVQAELSLRLSARGYDPTTVERARALNARVLDYQRTGAGRESLESELRQAASQPWFGDAEDIPAQLYAPDEYEWWRSVMDFNASDAWSRVAVPILLLKGGADDRSPADVMRDQIADALTRGSGQQPDVVVFPGADHMLLRWPFGQGVPPPQFADGFLETLLMWITDQARRGAKRPS